MNKFFRSILCLLALLCVLLSGCSRKETIVPSEHIDRIIEACSDSDNTFPDDKLKVEFLKFDIPNSEQNHFQYTFRFENISGQTLKTQILVFYDIALNERIIAHIGGLQPSTPTPPLILEPNEGWAFDIPISPAEYWDSYSADEQNAMIDLAKHLYFEITLDKETFYCILDFQSQKVLSIL